MKWIQLGAGEVALVEGVLQVDCDKLRAGHVTTVLLSDWLQVVETLYWLVVSWAPVSCVHTYHLSYRSPAGFMQEKKWLEWP